MEAHFPCRSWHAGQTGRSMKIIFPLHTQRAKEKGRRRPYSSPWLPLPKNWQGWKCSAYSSHLQTPAHAAAHTGKPFGEEHASECQAASAAPSAAGLSPALPCRCAHPFSCSLHPCLQTPITTMQLQCHGSEPLADQALLLWMVHLPKDAHSWLEKPNIR